MKIYSKTLFSSFFSIEINPIFHIYLRENFCEPEKFFLHSRTNFTSDSMTHRLLVFHIKQRLPDCLSTFFMTIFFTLRHDKKHFSPFTDEILGQTESNLKMIFSHSENYFLCCLFSLSLSHKIQQPHDGNLHAILSLDGFTTHQREVHHIGDNCYTVSCI